MPSSQDLHRFKTKLLVFPHLLIVLLSLPLALRLVPPNRAYGFRTPASLASSEIWYASNFQAGVAGVVLGTLGAAFVWRVMRSPALSERRKALIGGAAAVFVAVACAVAGLLAS